jgi:hypothetical protein
MKEEDNKKSTHDTRQTESLLILSSQEEKEEADRDGELSGRRLSQYSLPFHSQIHLPISMFLLRKEGVN